MIKQRTSAVINITTGGAPTMLVEERVGPAAHFKPEVASLNMGTMNFGLYPMLARQKEFKYDWEKPYLEGSRERVFKNTFADIEYILTTCANNGTRFEIECYDIGHLYTLRHFADRGVIKPPFFIQSVFGILGGIGPHPEDVLHMKRTADRLFGDEYHWSVLGAGRNQMAIAAQSAAMGGNVRVGLEDSLWIGPGQLAKSNAEQVTKARQIIEGLGLESPAATRRARCSSSRAGTRSGSECGCSVIPAERREQRESSRTRQPETGFPLSARLAGMTMGWIVMPDPPARRSSRVPRSGRGGIRRRAA